MLHEGRAVPDLEPIFDIAKCRHGPTINHEGVIEALHLELHPTESFRAVCVKGGILAINHPIFNLHAVAVWPSLEQSETVVAVNTFLGPEIARYGIKELQQFEPTPPNNKHWSVRKLHGGVS